MLVKYNKSNLLTVGLGEGKTKLVFVPGLNVISDADWDFAKATLADHIKKGILEPLVKVEKVKTKTKTKGKDGKETEVETETEVEKPLTPDEIPNDKLEGVVNSLQSEAQAEKFINSADKESVRAAGARRQRAIEKEVAERKGKDK